MWKPFALCTLFMLLLSCEMPGREFSVADSVAVEALLDSAGKYVSSSPERALEYADQAEILAKKSHYPLGQIRAWNHRGDVYNESGRLAQAEACYQKCHALADSMGQEVRSAAILDKLGTINRKLGNYPKALAYHQEAKLIFERQQVVKGISVSLNNMAIISKYLGDTEGAMQQYRESAAIAQKSGQVFLQSASQINMSILFTDLGELDSAEMYGQQVLALCRENGFKSREADALSLLGGIKAKRMDHKGALDDFEQARAIAIQQNNRFLEAGILVKEGAALWKLGKRTLSKKKLKAALEMAEEMGALEISKSALDLLHNLAVDERKFEAALDYYKRAMYIQDSILGAEALQSVALVRDQYLFEKKERELAQVNLELEREVLVRQARELDLAESRSRIWILVAIAALLGLVAVYVFGRYVNGRRQARLLEERQEMTAQALAEKEILLGEIHHRVKNNLQVIYNMLDMQARGLEDEAARAALGESMNRVSSMALIHQELYREGNVEGVRSREFLHRLAEHVRESYGGEESGIALFWDVDDMLLDLDSAIPMGMLVNELLANSFKHAFQGKNEGRIKLSLSESGGALVLEVADNGAGPAPQTEGPAGFGSRLIRSLARQMRAEVIEHSGDGMQTILKINKYKRLDNG